MSRDSLLALCLLLVAPAMPAQIATLDSGPAVIGYVFPQNTILQPTDVDARSVTRLNYAFANIQDGRMVMGFSHDEENFAVLTRLRRQNPSLKVLVSVGGWLWSGGFSDVALTKESRKIFIQSVVEFLTRYDLDGLDIDWEYPGMVGAGHRFRGEDKANFTILLQELRERFDREVRHSKRRWMLSIAAGASDEFVEHTEMAKVQRYVDSVNLMAYDYYVPSVDKVAGHHAPLFTNPADPKKISVDASVHAFEAAGVPAAKIVLGIPFYGHVWGQVADHEHGLYQQGHEVPNAYAPYGVISSKMLHDGFERFWDPVALAPYLYNSQTQIFVTYDDPESVAAKCSYVLKQRLGGVMFWDYSGDYAHELLNTINAHLRTTATTRQ